jgi:dTDP-glucose pyrophosphorylase
VYVLTRESVGALRRAPVSRSGERGITDGMRAAIDVGITFGTVPFSGYYANVNSAADLESVARHVDTPSCR